jgi:hypothetical protein
MQNIVTVIYFNEPHKNTYANFQPDEWHAKRLAKRIFRNAMTALATEREKRETLLHALTKQTELPPDNNIQTDLP